MFRSFSLRWCWLSRLITNSDGTAEPRGVARGTWQREVGIRVRRKVSVIFRCIDPSHADAARRDGGFEEVLLTTRPSVSVGHVPLAGIMKQSVSIQTLATASLSTVASEAFVCPLGPHGDGLSGHMGNGGGNHASH